MPEANRIFGLAPGVDFPQALVDGLAARMAGQPPDAWARVTLILNTRRMARRIRDILDDGPPRLLPRILLLSDLGQIVSEPLPEPAYSALGRRLELARFVRRLQEKRPELAAETARFELADSLAALMDEMQGEGVEPGRLAELDVSEHSEHYAQTQEFLSIIETYLRATQDAPEGERRQRVLTERLIAEWDNDPPQDPVILAGSTASRGTTRLLMEAVARLEQGLVVLPGFDFEMPEGLWHSMSDAKLLPAEDHPQYRFQSLMERLSLSSRDITPWIATEPPSADRNKLVSLALRPAPVTDAWRKEGPLLGDLERATDAITLIEAESPRSEALAIALRLRQAAEDGQNAALITPDRMLTRQVAAALDQWNIIPDDSAGMPLHLSPTGRFLRHTAELMARPLAGDALLAILKHPLTHKNETRNEHQLNTQRLELRMRREGMPFADPDALGNLAPQLSKRHGDEILEWLDWVKTSLCVHAQPGTASLTHWVERHFELSETVSKGQGATDTTLWNQSDGEKALSVMNALRKDAGRADDLTAIEYGTLLHSLLSAEEVRDSTTPHPGIMIWGTLEARVQGAELVIMGSLNDGVWPEQPAPDPWLNRALRHQAGLLLPDRRIGLSAHDFQQALAAPEVWITRAIRTTDAETVPSRWINRITNLMAGLTGNNGPQALEAMLERGQTWLDRAAALEEPVLAEKAQRPSPQPPQAARPRTLSVSDVKTLIRDPYAIYAKHILHLSPVGPLAPQADARLRGTAIHRVMEAFVQDAMQDPKLLDSGHLNALAARWLEQLVPWPAARTLWQSRVAAFSDWFVDGEKARQSSGQPIAFEDRAKGRLELADIGMTVTARADRIDSTETGDLIIYDYKTGKPPSPKEQIHFDRQLLIEAAIAEQGGLSQIGPRTVEAATYIGLTSSPILQDAPLQDEPPQKVLNELRLLLSQFLEPDKGYTSRRAMQRDGIEGDYDQLARYGEWDASDDPVSEDLT